MRKYIYLLIIANFFIPILIVSTIHYFLWKVWVIYFKMCVHTFRSMIVSAPEQVREQILMFDANGLLHNINHLNGLNIRAFVKKSNEKMCDYVDVITYERINKQLESDNLDLIEYFTEAIFAIEQGKGSEISKYNITGLGNVAYTAVNHKNPEGRKLASDILVQIREHYSHF